MAGLYLSISPNSGEPLSVRNGATTSEVAYIDQALPSQNVLCYCPGYFERASAKKYCKWCVQNLGMLLGHLNLEKARATPVFRWPCLFLEQVSRFSFLVTSLVWILGLLLCQPLPAQIKRAPAIVMQPGDSSALFDPFSLLSQYVVLRSHVRT